MPCRALALDVCAPAQNGTAISAKAFCESQTFLKNSFLAALVSKRLTGGVHVGREVVCRGVVQLDAVVLGQIFQSLTVFIDPIPMDLDQRGVGRNFRSPSSGGRS